MGHENETDTEDVMRTFKQLFYWLGKVTGVFYLSSCLTGKQLRILAYHGTAMVDEGEFKPQLFIDHRLFCERMEYLARKKFPVLPLETAVEKLKQGSLPKRATVITFDDGFFSTYEYALPVLVEKSFPGTVYVTTYYVLKDKPVFRLVIQYMFWKTRVVRAELDRANLDDIGPVDLSVPGAREKIAWQIIDYGENNLSQEEREALCRSLGELLSVPYEPIAEKRFLSLMTADEVESALTSGIDIQLHTHRHRLPTDKDSITAEIRENQEALLAITGQESRHFCYPSGINYQDHYAVLEQLGIKTATTCDAGFNSADTPALRLFRFLDGNNISTIEFEAEMTGFAELLRTIRSRLKPAAGKA